MSTTHRSRPLGRLQIRLLEQLAMPTTKLWVNCDAQRVVTSASMLFDIGDGLQFTASVDAARVHALIQRSLLVSCEPLQDEDDGTSFQHYDLSRVGLSQITDDGTYPTLHDRLFGRRLVERYGLELAAWAGHGYARYGRGAVVVVPKPEPRSSETPYALTVTYLPLLRLGTVVHDDMSFLDLCTDYDPATSYVLSLSFSLRTGTTFYRLTPQKPALTPSEAAGQCLDPDAILHV